MLNEIVFIAGALQAAEVPLEANRTRRLNRPRVTESYAARRVMFLMVSPGLPANSYTLGCSRVIAHVGAT